ncbi:PTS lactose/cellobiose transporter subunit IIA [Clostridium sp. JN-9]|uniref:PTS lactose/cellobiose transporter subunit IIA n=1 Tax=Clostridium sp. JN-9 TaxID=2507159 RepID=UPI000FFE260F|nr:PTS lactose/cellobiose transporter subunit IIA [Clostridium sp. JN-9]QAT39801.1 PTS lactose/cellobiose transporter subunit IIA [Clostridium sp. JN-9]
MKGLELACFQIISSAGMAKSSFIEAIKAAKNSDFIKAKSCIDKGDEYFAEGHNIHTQLIQHESGDKQVSPNLLLVHAEDQLMSVETCKILANELIESYGRISALENK